METSPAKLVCLLWMERKIKLLAGFVAPSELARAARHATVAFFFLYHMKRKSALRCKRRTNPLFTHSRLEYP